MNNHTNNYPRKFADYKCCIIVPTYNNARSLGDIIIQLQEYTSQIVVINDGSTDDTHQVCQAFDSVEVLHLSKNKGKGYALRKGFELARNLGYDYAITIDSDGQHSPADVTQFIDKLEEQGDAIIVGARDMRKEGVPGKSSFGNKFSNFWFHVETDFSLPDTQSGYRLYPIKHFSKTRFFTTRYEFEIEILVRAAWSGIKIVSIPIHTHYFPKSERMSHFRPFIDFTRASILNTFLVVIAFLYIKPRNFIRHIREGGIKQVFISNQTNSTIAFSVGLGLFMGIVPIWGYQMIAAIALAIFLRLNKYLVVLAANVSIPPMIPVILYFSFKFGEIFLDNPVDLTFHTNISFSTIKTGVIQYIAGSMALALVAGITGGIMTYLLLIFFRKRQ